MQTYIETNCTIEHNGRTFESGGAVVTDDYIIAYPGARKPTAERPLNDWHGNQIGTCSFKHSWRIRSFHSEHMFQIYADVNGKRYTGRGMGEGMICRLRPVKGQPCS